MMMHLILTLAALSLPTPGSAGLLSSGTSLVGSVTQVLPDSVDNTVSGTIDQTSGVAVGVLSSQCSTLRSLLSLEYKQLKQTGTEPDLSTLTLNHITKNSYKSYELSTAAEEITKSRWFNPDHGLVIFVHGFTESADKPSSLNVIDAFNNQGQYNVLSLDASALIQFLYLRSTTYVTYIGEALGWFMSAMYDAGLPTSLMHLVGFSLGSHIAGFAGKTFTNVTGHKMARITGLDPAGPCYTDVDTSLRLAKTDAEFVDVMHSNAGVLGLNENIGHVDFWPNGGSTQPECTLHFNCSHFRSILMFSESVESPDGFKAVACDSWSDFTEQKCRSSDTSLMGFGCSNETRGTYYLQTAASSPFALGEDGITYDE